MGGRTCKRVEVLFFGAGKKGQYWVKLCKEIGIVPKGILDNAMEMKGKSCEGIMIHHPDELEMLSFTHICITCNRQEEIYRQLTALGVERNKIVAGDHDLLNLLFHYAVSEPTWFWEEVKPENLPDERRILFDLHNGMVLGGVEAWVYGLAGDLKTRGHKGLYLTTDAAGTGVMDVTFPAKILNYKEVRDEKERIRQWVKEIIKNLPCIVICNFPWNIFWSACIAKSLFPDLVRIVAGQHNDDQSYYRAYSLWQEYIDKCLVISSQMEKKLLLLGMDKKKTCRLEWEIECKEKLERTWNGEGACLQIGYAGRITMRQKRADLFPVLAMKLREKGVCFCMNIAGAGDYSDTLLEQIKKEKLQECVMPLGYIDRKDVPFFWSRQDIMVSCSEWEGHSISQTEAMAGGAVPVLTNVSGVEDDVTDGYNGYIVEPGDVDGLVEKICLLYHDRKMLAAMGKNAHDTIYQRQIHIDQTGFWERLLKEI